MIRSTKSSWGSVRAMVAWALILVLCARASGVAAQDDCEVLDRYGEPRECTFTEALADCTLDAFDSWEQCMENADGWLDRIGCEATGVVDNAACLVSVPVSWGLGRLF